MLDLLRHRGLLGRPLDELGVQQVVFVLVMTVQPAEDEIDVIGQERDPSRRGRRAGAYQPRGFVVRLTEQAVDDRHVAHFDRL
jgi:hypothetical protein